MKVVQKRQRAARASALEECKRQRAEGPRHARRAWPGRRALARPREAPGAGAADAAAALKAACVSKNTAGGTGPAEENSPAAARPRRFNPCRPPLPHPQPMPLQTAPGRAAAAGERRQAGREKLSKAPPQLPLQTTGCSFTSSRNLQQANAIQAGVGPAS
jgi:hypothetical protein